MRIAASKAASALQLLSVTANLSFIDQAVVSGGNFTAGILMARAFGLYEFGRFTLVWMGVEFLMSIQFAIVIQPMLNIGPKQSAAQRDGYFSAVAVQQAVSCLAMGSIVGLATWLVGAAFDDPALSALGAPLFAVIVLYQLQGFFRRYLFLRQRPIHALLVDLLRFGVQLPATFALLLIRDGGSAEVGLWIIVAACATSAGFGACCVSRFTWQAGAFRQVLARHWQFSKWLVPSAVMHWLTSQAYLLMCGIVLGAAMTGGLRAAMGITGILNILVQALDNFAPAQAARAFHRGGQPDLLRYVLRLGLLVGVLTAIVVVGLSVASGPAIRLLYGEQYDQFGYLVRWLCAPAAVYSASVVLTIWAAAMEWTRLIFRSYVAATIFTLVAAYPLAHFAGILGIVVTWLAVECIRAGVLFAWLRKGEGAMQGKGAYA